MLWLMFFVFLFFRTFVDFLCAYVFEIRSSKKLTEIFMWNKKRSVEDQSSKTLFDFDVLCGI